MKYCRFSSPEGPQYALVEAVAGTEQITHSLPSAVAGLPDLNRAKRIAAVPLTSASLLSPVQPSKIVCVGRNYVDHAKELGNEPPVEPLIFFKPPSSIIAHKGGIVYPKLSENVHYEGELAAVVGQGCYKVTEQQDVRSLIFGYTCANEVTARDLQKKDSQWTRAKGFDTFCPLGPVVSDAPDPWKGVQVETRVNGETRQSGNTRDFIFPLDLVIRYITRVMTLLPGDLILTGTPSGVGPLAPGDAVEVAIEGIGTLRNSVVAED